MKDIMVDIESLGNGKNGLICQIGACYFDRYTGEIGDTFKININPVDAEKYGRELDASTVMWWLSQGDAARGSITDGKNVGLMSGIQEFCEFISNSKAIWSHATYDFVMLNETCRALSIKQMPFRKARDIRTLVDLARVNTKSIPRIGTHHDALEDALHQVKYCVIAFNKLRGTNDNNG
jgi:hypothetical protein